MRLSRSCVMTTCSWRHLVEIAYQFEALSLVANDMMTSTTPAALMATARGANDSTDAAGAFSVSRWIKKYGVLRPRPALPPRRRGGQRDERSTAYLTCVL